MQDDPSQDWQKPSENASGAPFQPFAASNQAFGQNTQNLAQNEQNIASETPQSVAQRAVPVNSTPTPTEASQPDFSPAEVAPSAPNSPTDQAPEPETPAENQSLADDEILVRWQAVDHPQYDRGRIWYVALVLVTIALMAVAYFVFRSLTFVILLPVMAVALGFYAYRPPEIVDYTLTRKGLYIRDRLFFYDQFRAFGVVTVENSHHITLIPRKRFQMSQNIYFPEEVGENIVDMLAARLPMSEIKPDLIDRFLAKIRL